jgi:hypothetical protein
VRGSCTPKWVSRPVAAVAIKFSLVATDRLTPTRVSLRPNQSLRWDPLEKSPLRTLDVYALVDADSGEAKTFTTYLNYWLALSGLVTRTYGPAPYDRLLTTLQEQPSFRSLCGKKTGLDAGALRSLLLNAWNSELALHLIELTDADRLWVANQWGQVQSYFATSRSASAWNLVRDGTAPERHRALLNSLAAQFSGTRLYPVPWNLTCTSLFPPTWAGFPFPPTAVHNLSSSAEPEDRIALMLKTTREREIKKRVEQLKREQGRRHAPKGEARRRDTAAPVTTVFDFTWRMRTRSNYGDPAMFYVGTLSDERSRDYAVALRTFTGATMFLFETLIAEKARGLLEEAAVHFITRDRTRLADRIIVPRLRAMGLLR